MLSRRGVARLLPRTGTWADISVVDSVAGTVAAKERGERTDGGGGVEARRFARDLDGLLGQQEADDGEEQDGDEDTCPDVDGMVGAGIGLGARRDGHIRK